MSRNINMKNNMQEVEATMNNETKNNNVEVEAMANKNTKNEEGKVMANKSIKNKEGKVMENNIKETTDTTLNNKTISIMSSAISEMIPAGEREVSEKKHSMDIVPFTVTEVIETVGNTIPEIPENERAEIDKENYIDLEESKKHGFFDPIRGMMGFKTNTEHFFYARIFTDTKGNHWIEYCQKYSNGSYSGKIRVKQADLITGAYYIWSKENTENGDSTGSHSITKHAGAKVIVNARNDYYNKTTFPKECVNIEQIFMLLLSVYNSLPAESDELKVYDSPDKLYKSVMNAIQKEPIWLADNFHKSYYAFDTEQIDMIANELNIKRDLLLKKLKEHKFLYLTDSSKGYQTYVRFPAEKDKAAAEFFPKSHLKWSYCILKLEYLAGQITKREQEQA